jgi:hypothetical protein
MREKDSQVVSIFTLSGSTSVKAERKCVGEIDTCSQFHRHFTLSLHANILSTKNYKAKL